MRSPYVQLKAGKTFPDASLFVTATTQFKQSKSELKYFRLNSASKTITSTQQETPTSTVSEKIKGTSTTELTTLALPVTAQQLKI